MALKIREAEKQDMDLIAEFIRSSVDWYKPFLSDKDLDEHDVNDEWKEKNYKRRDFYLGVNEEDEEVGTISMQYFGDTVYLGYIYLDVKHVGNGYGPRLIDYAKRTAIKQGMKKMILISHPKATWATKTYKRYGFKLKHEKKEDILSYQNGLLKPYYEEGFHLYEYDLSKEQAKEAQRKVG